MRPRSPRCGVNVTVGALDHYRPGGVTSAASTTCVAAALQPVLARQSAHCQALVWTHVQNNYFLRTLLEWIVQYPVCRKQGQ